MKPFAQTFYNSPAWKRLALAVRKERRNLCEICLAKGIYKPGEIVHHKIPLTPENITNPEIALNPDNLILVCRECHAIEHGARERRYTIDELGRVICG